MSRDIAEYERVYAASTFETVQATYRKRMLLELMERLRPRRVLEVGCGLDTLANHWRGAEAFVVVEPGAQFAKAAREATAGREDVTVIEALLEDAGLADDFDLILLSGLLHEVSDCEGLVGAARALAGPQTVVHANVPNARSLHRLLALEMGLIKDVAETSELQKALQQSRIFTVESLAALLEASGLSPFESGSYFVKPFTHGQMAQLQGEGFLTERMLEGLWGLSRWLPEFGSEIFVNARPAG